MKIITVIWLLFMLILSHIPGEPSGEESRLLSRLTGVKESTLRRSAHVVLYLILGALVMVSFPDTALWIKAVVLVIIAAVDESSKALRFFPGRHCSLYEMGLNCAGVVAGLTIGLLLILVAGQ